MDLSFLVIVIQLIFLEGILSIDNAAVLGALVLPLPADQAIIWPGPLKKLGDRLHGILGNQREAALRVGLLGAYLGRGLMLFLASYVVQNPWLKFIGALYLIKLAFDNLGMGHEELDEEAEMSTAKEKTFWGVVLTVELADLVFSLDNVVAAVSLSDQLWVVMLGVAIGILLMRFAAGIFSFLISKEPILKTAAYILVLNIGIELMLEEFHVVEITDWMKFGISMTTILLTLAYAHFKPLQLLRPVLIWLAQGFALINELADWLLLPITAILGLIARGIAHLFKPLKKAG